MVDKLLLLQLLYDLDQVGRSRYLIKKSIDRLWDTVRRAVSSGSSYYWEEMEYLSWRYCECLVHARAIAVRREEYEWAAEITAKLRSLDWSEEEIKKEFKPLAK